MPAARLAFCLLIPAIIHAGPPSWLDWVEPIVSPAEKKTYLALNAAERQKFEADFWAGKNISADDYRARLETVDAKFGSSRKASGANTDPGRVWLSLGPPNRIRRVPSSRIFVPLEIWYYEAVPGVLSTELHLIFYQPNSVGLPRLYSPPLENIRNLLVPQAATRGMFGPNNIVTESDIRRLLRTGPAEDEVIAAAVDIASGIKGTGNTEILAQITSPRQMLTRGLVASVRSKFITVRPELEILEVASPFAGRQIDFQLVTDAEREIEMEVLQGTTSIYRNRLQLSFPHRQKVEYLHRLDLLPGSYRVLFTVDGILCAYALEAGAAGTREIRRYNSEGDEDGHDAPFVFDGKRLDTNSSGRYAAAPFGPGEKVSWRIRRGGEVVWRSSSTGQLLATVELPLGTLPAGAYRLEAVGASDSAAMDLLVSADQSQPHDVTRLSFNANLGAAKRLAFVGHQWLLRGDTRQAQAVLSESLARGTTDEARIELARAKALTGNLDEARSQVQAVLAGNPENFEALSVLAYVEAGFQDFSAAAELYRRALAIQNSPALRNALASLPSN